MLRGLLHVVRKRKADHDWLLVPGLGKEYYLPEKPAGLFRRSGQYDGEMREIRCIGLLKGFAWLCC